MDAAAWMVQEEMDQQVMRQQQQQQDLFSPGANDWNAGFVQQQPPQQPLPDPSFCLQDNWTPDIDELLNEAPLPTKGIEQHVTWHNQDLFEAVAMEPAAPPPPPPDTKCLIASRLPPVVVVWLKEHEGISDPTACEGEVKPLRQLDSSCSVMGEDQPVPASRVIAKRCLLPEDQLDLGCCQAHAKYLTSGFPLVEKCQVRHLLIS